MKIRKYAAASLFAIASTTIASGTVHAEEPAPAVPSSAEGTDHGVGYRVSRNDTAVVTTLTGGTFQLAGDVVHIIDSAGVVIASLPKLLSTTAGDVQIAAGLDSSGTTLTAEPIGHWRQISPRQRSIEQGQGLGMVVGFMTGGVIGMILGLLTVVLFPITALIGAGIGGAAGFFIGGAAGGAVPNSDVPEWEYVPDALDHDPFDLDGNGLRDD